MFCTRSNIIMWHLNGTSDYEKDTLKQCQILLPYGFFLLVWAVSFPMEKLAVIPQHSWIPPSLIPLLHLGYTVITLFTLFITNGSYVLRKEPEA